MIVPSIDLMDGEAVQLVGGREKALGAGDPRPLAQRFAIAGETAIVDLDAALGRGDNTALIEELLDLAPCRVGGGIRSAEAALDWLDRGAVGVVLGTAAVPEVLGKLPKERTHAALDAVHGAVVVEGWRRSTGQRVLDRIGALKPYVGGFLVTFVEREGRLEGIDLEEARRVVEAADPVKVTIAGGVTTLEEIAELDRMGADAQVGMALYTGRLHLADAFAAPLWSERADGRWPTVVKDARGQCLGLVWSDAESLRVAFDECRGVYSSRRRGLWRKGESSGNVQELVRVEADCDRDSLSFTVRQAGTGFCHRGTASCFGEHRGLARLEETLRERLEGAPAGSYTARLASDPALLRAKLLEEAGELAAATAPEEIAREAADVLYFTLVRMVAGEASLADAERELDRRALRVRRRPGDAKPPPAADGTRPQDRS